MPVKIFRRVGRPASINKAMETFIQRTVRNLNRQQRDKDLVASGESLSFEADFTAKGITLRGADYLPFITEGRAPGRFPPPDAIIRWINQKGIEPEEGQSVESLAFLIGRAMAQTGSQIWKGEREGLRPDDAIDDRDLDQLLEAIGDEAALGLINQFLTIFQKAAPSARIES